MSIEKKKMGEFRRRTGVAKREVVDRGGPRATVKTSCPFPGRIFSLECLGKSQNGGLASSAAGASACRGLYKNQDRMAARVREVERKLLPRREKKKKEGPFGRLEK